MAIKNDSKLVAPYWESSATAVQVGTKSRKDLKADFVPDFNDIATFRLDELPDTFKDGDTVKSLAAYGLQKLFQERASAIPEAADKVANCLKVFAHLKEGEWNGPRVNAVREPNHSWTLAALFELGATTGIPTAKGLVKATAPQILAAWNAKTAEDRKALAEKPEVKALADKLKAAKPSETDAGCEL